MIDEGWYKDWNNFIKGALKKLKFHPKMIVDAACGTGRLTKYLEKLGQVTGIDSSPEMIRVARKKFGKNARVIFRAGNLMNFSLPKKQRVNLIVCAFDTLNYLDSKTSLKKTFLNFSRNLSSGGYIFFDINGEKAFACKNRYYSNKREFQIGKTKIIWTNHFYPKKWKVIFHIIKPKGKRIVCEKEIHEEYYYDPWNIDRLLAKTGFKTLGIYTDHKLKKWKAGTKNERYFFVAQRIA